MTLAFTHKPFVMRISLQIPRPDSVAAFLAAENAQRLTYAPLAATRTGEKVAGHDNDELTALIGAGATDFERAKSALRRWAHFPPGWTAIRPVEAPIETGAPVAMFFRIMGCWWRNSCRIVYVLDEPDRYGFAYGTLPGHIESGEELFWVARRPDGRVEYGIRAFSRPRLLIVRLAYPLARCLQEKFRQDSAQAMRAAVSGDASATITPDGLGLRLTLLLAALAIAWPGSFMGHAYAKIPSIIAFLLFTPLVLSLSGALRERIPGRLLWAAGLMAVLALWPPAGLRAALLAAPWWGVAALEVWRSRKARLPMWAAGWFWLTGATWFWAERMGLSILGFGAEWSALTALHFHFAGLGLPIIADAAARMLGDKRRLNAAHAMVAGMVLTAAGITASRFGAPGWFEALTAVYTALAGAWAALTLLRAGRARGRGVLTAAGALLLVSMMLALGFALRFFWPSGALSIDEMRAWHGSLNAAALVLAAWSLGSGPKISEDL